MELKNITKKNSVNMHATNDDEKFLDKNREMNEAHIHV